MISRRSRPARFESVKYRLADGTERRRLLLTVRCLRADDPRPQRLRVALGVDDSRKNRRLWEGRRRQIENEVISGTFDPVRWFGTRFSATQEVPTVGQFAQEWLREIPSQRTRAHYELILRKHLLPDPLAAQPLQDLHDGHLRIFQRNLSEKEPALETATVNKIFARVRTIVNLAFQRGLIPRPQSPAALVKNLPMPQREVDPFTADEFLRILRACISEQQRALYILLGLTGLRPSEALGLWWSDINFADSLIAVRRQLLEDGSVTDRLKTSRSRRDVVMLPPVRETLLDQRARSGLLGNLVFVGRLGAPMKESTQGDNPWRRALTRAGVPYRTLYNLRHTYTTFMLSAGRPIQWIAHQLGHVGVRKIDEVYGRWVHTPADRMLDLGELCRSVEAATAKAAALPAKIWPKGKAKTPQVADIMLETCPGRESNPD